MASQYLNIYKYILKLYSMFWLLLEYYVKYYIVLHNVMKKYIHFNNTGTLNQWSPTTGPRTGTGPWTNWYWDAQEIMNYFPPAPSAAKLQRAARSA